MPVTARFRHLIAALLVTLGLASSAYAVLDQPGTPDPTFAVGASPGAGKVITAVGSGSDAALAVVIQPDGKVVLAGICLGLVDFNPCMLRYSASGALDSGFGIGGRVITPVGVGEGAANAIALQPDGKLVLAGYCRSVAIGFCMLRYSSDGSLDAGFGSGGKVITSVGDSDAFAHSIALQPDGKLVLAGNCREGSNTYFCALRYNANGALDASFGTSGKVITRVNSGADFAQAVTTQPDGKIVVTGYCSNGNSTTLFCTVRYVVSGALDGTFGIGGRAVDGVGNTLDAAAALVLQPDGRLVVAGSCKVGSKVNFCAVRYTVSGLLDATFGTGGKIYPAVGSASDYATAVVQQPDGKVILAGQCRGASNTDFCAVRYHANGVLDTSYGAAGFVITEVSNGVDAVHAAALQSDGKLLLAGDCFNGSDTDFCLVRYDGGPFAYKSCSLDIDGDNRVLATTDSLIHARIALGITGPAVVSGITFPTTATRNTWPLIRDYLVRQCGMSLVQ